VARGESDCALGFSMKTWRPKLIPRTARGSPGCTSPTQSGVPDGTMNSVTLRHRLPPGESTPDRAAGALRWRSLLPRVYLATRLHASRHSTVFPLFRGSLFAEGQKGEVQVQRCGCVIRARLLARSETTLPRRRRPRWLARRAHRLVRDRSEAMRREGSSPAGAP
jgi:hypothetical protein